jgi:hypothetical protein
VSTRPFVETEVVVRDVTSLRCLYANLAASTQPCKMRLYDSRSFVGDMSDRAFERDGSSDGQRAGRRGKWCCVCRPRSLSARGRESADEGKRCDQFDSRDRPTRQSTPTVGEIASAFDLESLIWAGKSLALGAPGGCDAAAMRMACVNKYPILGGEWGSVHASFGGVINRDHVLMQMAIPAQMSVSPAVQFRFERQEFTQAAVGVPATGKALLRSAWVATA